MDATWKDESVSALNALVDNLTVLKNIIATDAIIIMRYYLTSSIANALLNFR